MGLISENDRKELEKVFKERLKGEVEIELFLSDRFPHSKDARQIAEEVASLDDRIRLSVYGEEEGNERGYEFYPVTTFKGHENVLFYGLPSGYEFVSLIEDIIMASGNIRADEHVMEHVKSIGKDVEIKGFITPTCPYCPKAVIAAHKFAFLNPKIRGIMVESLEFPDFANKYNVRAVPKIVINDKVEFEGAVPEEHFIHKVMEAIGEGH